MSFLIFCRDKIKKGKKIFFLFLSLFLLFCITGIFLWYILPSYCDDPLQILAKATAVKSYFDRENSLVKRERSWQYQWRLHLSLAEISPEVIKVILAAEDASFYKHGGVDLFAICRAMQQNIFSGRIVSGASTIPMQLAALAMRKKKIPRRTLSGKILQALMARKLVQNHPKDTILEEYLNRIPFGGNIYGIGAASLYYFGLPADKLNLAEASLLCGIPQRPAGYRPDRNLFLARKRQKRVLQMLEKKGILPPGDGEKIYQDSPLRLRDFSYSSPLAGKEKILHNIYFKHAGKELAAKAEIPAFSIHTALDQEMTRVTLDALKKYVMDSPDVKDAAAVLIDNQKMEVRVCIGTLDFFHPAGGQVDASHAVRSAGSTLKPFLYGEGLYGGLVSPDTIFRDAPLRYKDYAPLNFDGKYRGRISLEEALQLSLNTTAIKMLALTGEKRIEELFSKLGLSDPSGKKNGLSLALGSAGYTLFALTNAFSILPNEGKFQKVSFLNKEKYPGHFFPAPQRIWNKNTALTVCHILRRPDPPFTNMDAAWKTGTSNGNRDAWCLAATPEYTLGVWFGNKDGSASPNLVGITLAAPCAASILKSLYKKGEFPAWEETISLQEKVSLCVESGLKATRFCPGIFTGRKIKEIPLRSCRQCTTTQALASLQLYSPKSGNYFLPEGKNSISIPILAEEKDLICYIDGIMLKKLPSSFSFSEGSHRITLVHPHGRKKAQTTFFEVIRRQ